MYRSAEASSGRQQMRASPVVSGRNIGSLIMRLLLIPLLSLAGSVGLVVGGESPAGYSQSYAIFIKGAFSGTETVTESVESSGNPAITSEHEIFVTDGLETKRMAFVTTMVLSKKDMSPLRYSYRYTSGTSRDSYEVIIKDGSATCVVMRSGHKSETTKEFKDNQIILDFNVYHQYKFLALKYDYKTAGQQTFADYIPLLGDHISVVVEFLGNGILESENGSVPVRNFKVSFPGIGNGTFSIDASSRLVRLLMPAQNLEVVKRELVPERKQ